MPRAYQWLSEALTLDSAGGLQSRTGIPAPVIARAARGEATLSPASRASLYNAYRADVRHDQYTAARMVEGVTSAEARKISSYGQSRYDKYMALRDADKRTQDEAARASQFPSERLDKYRELRNAGMWVREAEQGSRQEQAEVRDAARELRDIARQIAKGNAVKIDDVLRGMSYSDRTISDWEQYIRRRKSQHWVPQRQVKGAPGLYKREPKGTKALRNWERRRKRGTV